MNQQISPRPAKRLGLVPRQKLGDDIAQRLKDHLPHLAPGSVLQEVWLGKQLGVSRTPIREALIRLAAEGLISMQPGGSYHVPLVSRRDVEELFEVRIALESAGARSLAPRISARQLSELEPLAKAADMAQSTVLDRVAWDQAEEAFHNRFLAMVGNRRMAEILNRQGLLERCLRIPILDWQTLAITDAGPLHIHLVETLGRHDSTAAEKAFRDHIITRRDWLLSHIR